MNRSNLMFVIEDTNNNKFGGYISSTINQYESWITDSKAFVFSLKSNGRLNGMKKFDITQPQFAFYLYQKSSQIYLFSIGGNDIGVCKKNYRNGGWGNQQSFNYEGHQNVLKGNDDDYTMKRFVVIQMQ